MKTFSHIFNKNTYIPPVIHLEFLHGSEFFVAWQLVEAFEGAGVPFVSLIRKGEKEVEVYVCGSISDDEVQTIIDEAREIAELADCRFDVEYSVLQCSSSLSH